MIHLAIAIFGILVTIFFVIGTHEAAHFMAARLFGVKVLKFSIGFGKTLFRFRDKHHTEYVFALIPLGGYVQMLDENEGKVPKNQLHLAYNRQPFYKKFLIVLAGPAMNIFCALVLYWLVFTIGFTTIKPIIGEVAPRSIAAEADLKPNQEITHVDGKATLTWTSILFRLIAHAGNNDKLVIEVKNPGNTQSETRVLDLSNWHLDELKPDPLKALGIEPFLPHVPLVVDTIQKKSPASLSKLQLGDEILAINKKSIKDWDELILIIYNNPDKTLFFTIKRDHKTLNIPVTTGYERTLTFKKYGYLGIAPTFEWPKEMLHKIQYGPLAAIPHAWRQVIDLTYLNLLLFGKVITGKISLQSLGGPVSIFENASEALNYGALAFISFLAFLSISIGVINLLPIPGLDGGHLFIQIIEFIMRRPVPEKFILLLYRLGLILLVLVLIQALANDILRMF